MLVFLQDPEGILPAPVPHHITRRNYEKKIAEDVEYKEKVERELQAEKEAQRKAREVILCMSIVPSHETPPSLSHV